jgi:predicted dehydrogenase
MTHRWNSNPSVSGGGVLIDNGTHSLDIMRYFLGSLAEIHVVEGKRIQNLAVEDTVHVFVRTPNGTLGSIDLSWSLSKELPNYISLYGNCGTLHVGWKESKYRLNHQTQWTVFGNGYDKIAAFQNQLENFCGAISHHEPLIITPEDGIASVCTVEAAYLAMQEGAWQRVAVSDLARMS